MKVDLNTVEVLFSELSLSRYRRDYDKANLKTRNYFWLFALKYYGLIKSDPEINIVDFSKPYRIGFYDDLTAFYDILSQFENLELTIETERIFESLVKISNRNAQVAAYELSLDIGRIHDSFKSILNPEYIRPEDLDLLDLKFQDNRHPHLPPFSNALLLFAENFFMKPREGGILCERIELKRNMIDFLDQSADNLLKHELILEVMIRIHDTHKTGTNHFQHQLRFDSAPEALLHLKAVNKGWKQFPQKRLSYIFKNVYCSSTGKPFSSAAIKKAIERN